MNINWNALTAISTLFMMIATFAIAIIAYKAMTSWRDEDKERKRLELIRATKRVLINLSSYLCTAEVHANKDNEEIKKYLIELHRLGEELLNMQDELLCINCAIFSGDLIEIITKSNNDPVFQMLLNSTIKGSVEPEVALKAEINGLLKNKEELIRLINKSIAKCNKEIQKFYK